MNFSKNIGTTISIAIFLGGCAVTEQTQLSVNVQIISAEQAKTCTFLDSVSSNNSNTLSENPEQDARNKALNRVAERGGNALKINITNTQIAPSGIGSIFTLSGEAYKCDAIGQKKSAQIDSQITNTALAKASVAGPVSPPQVPVKELVVQAPKMATVEKMTPAQAKAKLAALGYFRGDVTGNFSKASIAALKKYQKDNRLAESGTLDIETENALRNAKSK
jgi:hypothetical protein